MSILERKIAGIELRDIPYTRPFKLVSKYDHVLSAGYVLLSLGLLAKTLPLVTAFGIAAFLTFGSAAMAGRHLSVPGSNKLAANFRVSVDKELADPRLEEIGRDLEKQLADRGIERKINFFKLPAEYPFAGLRVSVYPFDAYMNKRLYIGLTPSLLKLLDKDELHAALGHEVTHSTGRMNALVHFGLLAANGLAGSLALMSGDIRGLSGFLLQVLVTLSFVRSEEFRCDRGAALLSQKPLALASALRKIATQRYLPLFSGDEEKAGKHDSGLDQYALPYPSVVRRTRRLQAMQRQLTQA
jgi:Zn-dependent protease with chaperone function